MIIRILFLMMALLSSGCTTIGVQNKDVIQSLDFGPADTLQLCVYKDSKLSDDRLDMLVTAIQNEFTQFGIEIEVPWVREWERPAFTSLEILDNLVIYPLEAPCDRIMGFIARTPTDILWSLALPTVYGAVEDVTMTKGFTVDSVKIAVHEFYHLLGCDHGMSATPCYHKIRFLKKIAREKQDGFYPSVNLIGQVFRTRESVEKALKPYLKVNK